MARVLKQSTSVDVPIGPFVDSTDGFTAETALTLTQPDIRLKKNGAAWAQKNAAQTLSHEENGYYEVTLDATDTNTLGLLRLAVNESGALPIFEDFVVVTANVWDTWFSTDKLQVDVAEWLGTAAATPTVAGVPEVDITHWLGTAAATPTVAGVPEVDVTHWIGNAAAATTQNGVPEVDITHIGGVAVSTTTAQLGVNVVQISGDATAADQLELVYDGTVGAVPEHGIIDRGTAQAATSSTIQLRAAAAFADNELTGHWVTIVGGSAGVGQSRRIKSNVGSTDTATVDAWTTTPTGTILYVVTAAARVNANISHVIDDPVTAGSTKATNWGGTP